MAEVEHQLLITTVHGTWGRGLFPSLQRQNRRRWFEEDSPFLDRLMEELGDIPHKITPLLWSGENSIYERNETAHDLAKHLSAEHAVHPQATQLVIAHSHGGNIALRALHLLRKRDASRLCAGEMPTPLVVTLATPFVEVQRADFTASPIRFLVLYAMAYLVLTVLLFIWGVPQLGEFGTWVLKVPIALLTRRVVPQLDESGVTFVIAALLALPLALSGFRWWDAGRAPARQRHIDDLNDATRLGEIGSVQAQRLLIIRAIDDEASLTLAFGTIVRYAILTSIATIGAAIFIIMSYFPLLMPRSRTRSGQPPAPDLITALGWELGWELGWKVIALAADIIAALTLSLFGILVLARAVHGRELSWSPMECQISTHSTPDAVGLSKIVTLVPGNLKSLRHGIYEYEDCVKAISDWVRSKLCALP
jgi:hypothetical protein